ncbi:organic hydroperoxide resistance protein [Rhizobium sp. SG570]|uniref:organic hydroperoxide resistance protein n=1 Tax=Rhizobium sp. SG570 TaxID=2587113 RepID=UPI001445C49D|nr:organic hydroperoxide resistance protein [Rhizobium sp. SG570]NKJ39855.1 Ohr subfamily peroxiredoxin [Rhizobium sp. SG570]
MSVEVKYKTSSTASGGRDGSSRTEDGRLDVRLSTPTELGGSGGDGTNPEQLFATGYAACFLSALKLVARTMKIDMADASVKAIVGIGPSSDGGYGLTVELVTNAPGLSREDAERVVHAAHQTCPYSNATRGNIDVQLTIA